MTPYAWLTLFLTAGLTLFLANYNFRVLPKRARERQLSTLTLFSTAVELRFQGHSGLTDRVTALSGAVGASMGLNARQLERLERASYLRDIGLCAVPWKMMNVRTPVDWSDEEHSLYLKHADVGGAMLELIPSLRDVASIVRYHHAPFDGSWGPTLPSGEDLPIESRLIAAVDGYVTRERMQGQVLARTYLDEQRGRELDPRVVDHLIAVLPSFRDIESPVPVAIR